MNQINWTPGIGDPTLLGWLTVLAYFLASILCVACAKRIGSVYSNENAAVHSRLWWFFAIVLLLLGINKQLDFQTVITEVGKVLAKRQGWYEQRKTVQTLFIAVVAYGGLFSLLFIWRTFKNVWKENWMALVGLVFIVSFILIRATSFHGVDRFLGLELSGVKANWFLELGGIAFFCISATMQLKRNPLKNRQIVGGKSVFL